MHLILQFSPFFNQTKDYQFPFSEYDESCYNQMKKMILIGGRNGQDSTG